FLLGGFLSRSLFRCLPGGSLLLRGLLRGSFLRGLFRWSLFRGLLGRSFLGGLLRRSLLRRSLLGSDFFGGDLLRRRLLGGRLRGRGRLRLGRSHRYRCLAPHGRRFRRYFIEIIFILVGAKIVQLRAPFGVLIVEIPVIVQLLIVETELCFLKHFLS